MNFAMVVVVVLLYISINYLSPMGQLVSMVLGCLIGAIVISRFIFMSPKSASLGQSRWIKLLPILFLCFGSVLAVVSLRKIWITPAEHFKMLFDSVAVLAQFAFMVIVVVSILIKSRI